ncbi:MAG: hypothetical protein SLAVMIC_00296 [uncultured marine phage]|uniref:Uncharacterized protein n=1 Tax=uncultured marine phage TaxID=707152 RepID=A0A8D9FQM8_9VIRU|nr:MAG: hypothetical protein SLAVMIC_00296 [uncultured marine phage]
MGKNDEKKENLQDEFEKLQSEHKDTNIEKYLVDSDEDLPGFGELDVYNYDDDLSEVKKVSEDVIEGLVDLYLGDAPDVKEHSYIKQKKLQDMYDYADSRFLSKMSKKLLLQNLRQIDNGDNSARMYEVATKLMGEIREINKDSRSSRSEIENFYKGIRSDLGLNDLANSNNVETDEDADGQIINTADLNNQIDDYLKNREKD